MQFKTLDYDNWQKLVDRQRYPSPFYEYDWQMAVARYYKAKVDMLYIKDRHQGWLAPVFSGLPWLTREELRLGSIGYGGPLSIHELSSPIEEMNKIKKVLQQLLIKNNAKKVTSSVYPAIFWNDEKVIKKFEVDNTVRIHLTGDINMTFNNVLSGNVRTAIRKSKNNNVTIRKVTLSDNVEFEAAVNLLQETQKRVGSSYVTDRELLIALMKMKSNDLKVKLFIAEIDNVVTAMALGLHNKHEFFHLFHGWDRSFSVSAVNQALIWSMIKHAEESNIPLFNMGSSHTDAILAAKLRYGCRIEPVPQLRVTG